jgi:hypothetical protein
MPKRQSPNRRIEGGPQGADAYVVIRRLNWGEQEDLSRQVESLTDSGQVMQSEQARELLANVIIEWNWVGDEAGEETLEQPKGNPDAFLPLYDDEITWLMGAITGQDTAEKKVPSPKS